MPITIKSPGLATVDECLQASILALGELKPIIVGRHGVAGKGPSGREDLYTLILRAENHLKVLIQACQETQGE